MDNFAVSEEAMARIKMLAMPWEYITSPQFYGLENIPDKSPLLFVGNHTLIGILDAPMMLLELYEKKGIYLRGLGDHLHFKIPGWRDLLSKCGVVAGTRENCARLMQAKHSILVFPGGAREVSKRKGEKYKLIWKQRIGFVRMAIQHGCTIIPFSAVGAEEMYDIVLDANEYMNSPFGLILKNFNIKPDILPPLVKGIGPTLIPKPSRLYFSFGKPIETHQFIGQHEDTELCFQVREQTKIAVEEGLAFLQEQRRSDPDRNFLDRFFRGSMRRS